MLTRFARKFAARRTGIPTRIAGGSPVLLEATRGSASPPFHVNTGQGAGRYRHCHTELLLTRAGLSRTTVILGMVGRVSTSRAPVMATKGLICTDYGPLVFP